MKWLLVVAILVGSAEAKLGVDIEWGFMQGKAIELEDLNGNMGGGSTWEYLSIGLSLIDRDSTRSSWGIVGQGFTSSSVWSVGADILTMDLEAGLFTLSHQRFLTPPGEKTRFYFRAGPTLAYLKAEASTPGLGGFSLSQDEWRAGFHGGLGVSHQVSKSVVVLGNVGYTYVNVDGTFDPSMFTLTVGLGFGG